MHLHWTGAGTTKFGPACHLGTTGRCMTQTRGQTERPQHQHVDRPTTQHSTDCALAVSQQSAALGHHPPIMMMHPASRQCGFHMSTASGANQRHHHYCHPTCGPGVIARPSGTTGGEVLYMHNQLLMGSSAWQGAGQGANHLGSSQDNRVTFPTHSESLHHCAHRSCASQHPP